MLIKYMGFADTREFFAGDTLNGAAAATPVNIVFNPANNHIVDTTLSGYSGVSGGWFTALLLDANFLNVTTLIPVPESSWEADFGGLTTESDAAPYSVANLNALIAAQIATLGVGSITSVTTSTPGTVTITNATGPAVGIAVTGGGGSGLTSFNGRSTAAAVPTSGDYTVSMVTGAAPIASPTFTGTPLAPTATAGTNTTQIATTAFVTGGIATAVAGLATLASPTFTGTPSAPTAAPGTNTTQLATTAFVAAGLASQLDQFTTITAVSTTPTAMAASILYTANTGASQFNLPASIALGQVFAVQRGSSTAALTITANTGQSINGGASGGSLVLPAGGAQANNGLIWLMATSATTYIVLAAVNVDAGLGQQFSGNVTALANFAAYGVLSLNGSLAIHALAKTAAYTTITSDAWIQCTSGTFTLTMGTTSFTAGTVQLVTNSGAGIITLAAQTGTIDLTTLPPTSGAILIFDGTNWHTVGSWGVAGVGASLDTTGPNAGNLEMAELPPWTSLFDVDCTTSGWNTLNFHQDVTRVLGWGTTNPVCGTFVARRTTVDLNVLIQGSTAGASYGVGELLIGIQPTFTLSTALPSGTPVTGIVAAAAGAAILLRAGDQIIIGTQTMTVGIPVTLSTSTTTAITIASFTPSSTYAIGTVISLGTQVQMWKDGVTPNLAAVGVTGFQQKWIGCTDPDSNIPIIDNTQITGLTIGQKYTWQVIVVIEGASQALTVGTDPTYTSVSPDNSTLWVCNFGANTVQPIAIGGRPGWKYGASPTSLAQWQPIVGTAVPITGTSPEPYFCQVSPDGTKLAVANYNTKTVTFLTITPGTNTTCASAVILGTSATGPSACTGVAWTSDSAGVWASFGNGVIIHYTAVASPVTGTSVTVGTNLGGIAINGSVGWAIDTAAPKVYPLTGITGSAATVGTGITVAAGGNCMDMASDNSVWVGSTTYVQHIVSGTGVVQQIAHGMTAAAYGVSLDSDGAGILVSGLAAVAFIDVAAGIVEVTTLSGTYGGTPYDVNQTTDGWIFITLESTGKVYCYPGGIFEVGSSFVPTGQKVRIKAQGCTLT